MGSFSITHWIVVLLIILVLFGTKKLRGVGSDLAAAVNSFRKEIGSSEDNSEDNEKPDNMIK